MEIGEKYLITTEQWFFAPDGEQYKAVFGTLHEISDAQTTLGVKTNARSTNWYAKIGQMTIAGCQINYACRCDDCSSSVPTVEWQHEDKNIADAAAISRIYMADQ